MSAVYNRMCLIVLFIELVHNRALSDGSVHSTLQIACMNNPIFTTSTAVHCQQSWKVVPFGIDALIPSFS